MSRVLDSANYCAKCGCDLNGTYENVRSPYDEDCCTHCDAMPLLTEEIVSEMEQYYGEGPLMTRETDNG